MPDWDASSLSLDDNLVQALKVARDDALARRTPSTEMVCHWHACIMRGLDIDVGDLPIVADDLIGQFRGAAGLEGLIVGIGSQSGVPPGEVGAEAAAFMDKLSKVLSALDAAIRPGKRPSSEDSLEAVLEVCA